MNNKNILTSIVVIFLITNTSCVDYLDLSPISSMSINTVYKTEADFALHVNGAYNNLQSLHSGQNGIPALLENRSDNTSVMQYNESDQGFSRVSTFIEHPGLPDLRTLWLRLYNLIDRCNAIIDNIDQGEFTDEARRAYYKGEAHFLRGYGYYNLAFMYGGVPIINTQMTSDEIKTIKRSSQEETFAFAANDFIQAKELLPEIWPVKELGKATKYSAIGLLAKLYFFQGDYSKAKPLLQEIISSGRYEMQPNYVDCFVDKYDNSPEHLFQVQYAEIPGQGNGYVTFGVRENVQTSQFPTGGGRGCQMSEDLYDSYDAEDVRRDISIIKCWYDMKTKIMNCDILYLIKFSHGTVPSLTNVWPVNLPILRYTEVKMMYAEILNEESYNSTGEAFSILNQVRERAGLMPLTSAEVPTQNAFREAILLERRLEFAGEWLRWYDLLRTDKVMTVMNQFLSRPDEYEGQYQMKEYQKIFPIPLDEIFRVGDTNYLWQNPGW